MIDVNRWYSSLTGEPEQTDDPVKKALSYLDPNPEADAPPSASVPAAAGVPPTSGSLSSYNDPTDNGTISTPLPPQEPSYQDPTTLTYPAPQQPAPAPTYTIQDGRTEPPTPTGQWSPVQTVQPYDSRTADESQRETGPAPWTPLSDVAQPTTPAAPYSPYGAPRDAAAGIDGSYAPDYGDGGRARREASPNYGAVQSQPGEPDYVRPRGYWEPTSTERRRVEDSSRVAATGQLAPTGQVTSTPGEPDYAPKPQFAVPSSIPLPYGYSIPISPRVQRTATQAIGALDATFGAAGDYLTGRGVNVWAPLLTQAGIAELEFPPDKLARYHELVLKSTSDMRSGDAGLTPAEAEEFNAMRAELNQRYQQMRNDPDQLTEAFNAAPGSVIYPLLSSVVAMAGAGSAKEGATALAQRAGAGARTARAIGYGADVGVQSVADPTNLVSQPLTDAAGAAIHAGARGVRGAAGRLAENAGRAPVPGEMQLGSGFIPNHADDMRTHVVPPEIARNIPGDVRLPANDGLAQAVENAGGSVSQNGGITLGITRAQNENAAGAPVIRGAVFYEPVPPGGTSRYLTDGPAASVGGNQEIPRTESTFRSPLVVSQQFGADNGFDEAMTRLGVPTRGSDVMDAIEAALRQGPPGSPERNAALKSVVAQFGGEPDMVDSLTAIYGDVRGEAIKALKEHIVSAQARAAGHDSVFILSNGRYGGRSGITEVADLREATYPTPDGGYSLRPEFQPRAAGRALSEGEMQLGSGFVPEGESRRLYHGTADTFGRPDPEKFDPNGLFGPGYYLTDDPRVAGGVGEPRTWGVNPETGSTINPDGSTYMTGDPSNLKRPGYAQNRAVNNLSMDQVYGVVDDVLTQAMRQRGYYSANTLEMLMDLHADISSGRIAKNPAMTPQWVLERTKSILGIDNPAADGMVNAIAGKVAPGANVRAVDVPPGLNLLDADAPMPQRDLDRIVANMKNYFGDKQAQRFLADVTLDDEGRAVVPTGQQVWRSLNSILSEPVDVGGKLHPVDPSRTTQEVNQLLSIAGYDGVTYAGGKRIPMTDGFGQPIEHQATMVFGESLPKIRNAFSGEWGGSGFIPTMSDARNAAQGAVVGAASPDLTDPNAELTPQERLARAGMGAVMGVAAGRSMRGRGAAAERRLGSGMVPGPGERPKATWVADARYQGGGFTRSPIKEAERRVFLEDVAARRITGEREAIEQDLRRFPDDAELQGRFESKLAEEEHARQRVQAAQEYAQMVRSGNMELGSGFVPDSGGAPREPQTQERPHVYSPTPPEGVKRRYHGTASEFDAADPGKFDENGLYGPGYYTTSDPRVASSYAENAGGHALAAQRRLADLEESLAQAKRDVANLEPQGDSPRLREAKGRLSFYESARPYAVAEAERVPLPPTGPNVRAIDVPSDLNMIDADAPLTQDTVDRINGVIARIKQKHVYAGEELEEAMGELAADMARRAADPSLPPLNNDAMLQHLMGASERAGQYTNLGYGSKGISTAILENAGFDGINHQGGKRVPMLDGTGKPIEHDVSVIFPGKVDKVTNAFSGTKGGMFVPFGAGAGVETDENGDPVGVDPIRAAGGMAVAGILNAKKFPGVQKALQASQLRASRLAAAGVKPLNPLQWTGELVKSVGYSSMIGIRTAATNLVGNVSEPIKALPRELTRSITPKAAGGEGDLGHFGAWATGNAKGALQIPKEVKDALMARGHYASNPDMPNLSERTINPISHAIALLPELGGRVFSGLPDAIFGSLARGAGEEMSAARIVRNTPMPGMKPEQHMAQIMADKQAILAGNPPADATRLAQAQQVLKDGQSYSNDMTYRNSLGTVSEAVKTASGAKVPVLGSLTTPFFTTPHNMNLRLLENSPVGFAMNTHDRPGTMRTKFDRVYDATVGTAVIGGLVYGLGMDGTFTGSGPADPEQREMLKATGWRPYSTLMTGTDGEKYYVPSKNFGNYGQLLNLIGELHDGIAYQKPGANAGEILGDAAARIGKQVQDTAYASGLTELVHLLDKPAQAGMGYVSSLATRATPYAASMRDIATSQDTLERKPEQSDGTLQGIGTELYQRWQAGTGIGRQELAPRTDVRGNPVENEQQGWRAFVPKGIRYRPDPLISELLGKNADLSAPRDHFTVTAAGADAPDGGIGTRPVRLTAKEQADWQRYRWEQLQQTFPMVNDPDFQKLPPSVKQKVWRDAVSAAGRTADGMVKQDIGPQWDARVQGTPVKQAS